MMSPVIKKNITVFSALPFANIYWWQQLIRVSEPIIDLGEYFEKMSFRNRYHIGSANGMQTLSIPLVKGRNQKTTMNDVAISYAEDWQKNHWKSLESAYMRTPFFEYYRDYIRHLYEKEYRRLADWNLDGIATVLKLLKVKISLQTSDRYMAEYEQDYRTIRPKDFTQIPPNPSYIQPFEHRLGFMPHLSVLDLLFCEGPASLSYLRNS